ncbi:MAG: hypothetical protein ACLP50_18155 [Solirubrobacteraceae bacterium]
MPIYLLHFSCRYRHAQHYFGFTDDIDRRLAELLAGRGSHLLALTLVSNMRLVSSRSFQSAPLFPVGPGARSTRRSLASTEDPGLGDL